MPDRLQELKILLVEDEAADQVLLRMSLEELGLPWRLEVLSDGQQALNRVLDEKMDLPHLILLDLSLPGPSGLEILRHLRGQKRWQTVPVVVLTTSTRQSDVTDSYRAGANTYVRKSDSYQSLLGDLRTIHQYWAQLASLDSNLGTSAA